MENKNKITFWENLLTISISIISLSILYLVAGKNNLLIKKQNYSFYYVEKQQEEKKSKEMLENNNQNKKEDIPFLDNAKIQISLWFVIQFLLVWISNKVKPKTVFRSYYPFFSILIKNTTIKLADAYLHHFSRTFITVLDFFVIVEIITSFFYLIVCLIIKKPWTEAFSVGHRFWSRSRHHLFFTIIIFHFQFVLNVFFSNIIKYFIGSFSFNEVQKETIARLNRINQNITNNNVIFLANALNENNGNNDNHDNNINLNDINNNEDLRNELLRNEDLRDEVLRNENLIHELLGNEENLRNEALRHNDQIFF